MKSFEPNYIGRDFVVGDLHGCYSSLMRAMDAISFDRSKDRLFSVGDLINRGSQSQACLELLSEPWFQAISGNHEVMFTTFLNSGQHRQHFLNCGGSWVLNPDTANFPSWQDWYQHWSARLSALPRAATLKLKSGLSIGLVHAECNESRWSQLIETDEDLIWGRFRIRHMIGIGIDGIDHVFCGHTIVNRPVTLGNITYLDTGAYANGVLSIADLSRFSPESPGDCVTCIAAA